MANKVIEKIKEIYKERNNKKNDILSNDICEIFTEICK